MQTKQKQTLIKSLFLYTPTDITSIGLTDTWKGKVSGLTRSYPNVGDDKHVVFPGNLTLRAMRGQTQMLGTPPRPLDALSSHLQASDLDTTMVGRHDHGEDVSPHVDAPNRSRWQIKEVLVASPGDVLWQENIQLINHCFTLTKTDNPPCERRSKSRSWLLKRNTSTHYSPRSVSCFSLTKTKINISQRICQEENTYLTITTPFPRSNCLNNTYFLPIKTRTKFSSIMTCLGIDATPP